MTTFVRRMWPCTLVVGVCVAATPIHVSAQRQGATLEGTVQDMSGAGVGGSGATVRETDTGLVRTTRSDLVGSFRLTDLPIGTYEVRVDSPGFAPYVHAGVTLAIGQTGHLLVVLQPAQ